jgi:hypothetical protein
MKLSRSLDKLFEEAHDDLGILVTRTRQLKRWTSIFRTHTDTDLAPHCFISNIEDSTLTIYVDSAAWATRLRFQVPQLIPVLRASNPVFAKLESIKVKVIIQNSQPSTQSSQHIGPTMSIENASGINSLSESIDDPALQHALQRLARHATQK